MDQPRPTPARVQLLRHAQSVGNVAAAEAHERGAEEIDLALRDVDVPLSDLGLDQARAFGRWLAEQPPSVWPHAVVTSPYERAVRTARVALDEDPRLRRIEVSADERLRERELGVLDLLTRRGVAARYPEEARRRERLGKFYHRTPGGESWADVVLRVRAFWDWLRVAHAGQRVLLVTHEVVVLAMRYVLEGLTEQEVLAVNRAVALSNCGLTTYDLSDGRVRLVGFDDADPVRRLGAPETEEPDVAEAPS